MRVRARVCERLCVRAGKQAGSICTSSFPDKNLRINQGVKWTSVRPSSAEDGLLELRRRTQASALGSEPA